jgi:hypothetical protein
MFASYHLKRFGCRIFLFGGATFFQTRRHKPRQGTTGFGDGSKMLRSIFSGEISAACCYLLQPPFSLFSRFYNDGLQQYDGIRGFAMTVHF